MAYDQASQPLDLNSPVGPQVFKLLRQLILTSTLEPGSRISESEIALHYRISRQPVRESFIRLAEEGLVEVRPQRGTFVRRIDAAAVLDARFARVAIEADIIKLLADNPETGLITDLRTQLKLQKDAMHQDDKLAFMTLDDNFHRTLAEATGKIHAWRLIEGLKSQMDRVRHLSLQRFPVEKVVSQHEAIVDALQQGASDAAETAIRSHLSEILNDMPLIAADHPSFFDLPATGFEQGATGQSIGIT